MFENKKFRPFPLLSGVHQQTIFGALCNLYWPFESKTDYVDVGNNDKIALEISTPKKWKESDLSVILVHGLCGSHRSPYLVRMARKLSRQGIRAVRVNLRNCGSGKGLSREIYHCGSSDDIELCLKHVKKQTPSSPIVLIGYSLGGHLVLKYGGERRDHAKRLVEKIIAVSPPVNLVSSMRLLCNPINRMYERYFLRHLLDAVYDMHKRFQDLPPVYLPENLTIFDFDELYVAPKLGYASAFEYYKTCSSLPLVPKITVPCHILLSLDDPIVDPHDIDDVDLPRNINVLKTANGGHMGYLGKPGPNFHWLDHILLTWILEEDPHLEESA